MFRHSVVTETLGEWRRSLIGCGTAHIEGCLWLEGHPVPFADNPRMTHFVSKYETMEICASVVLARNGNGDSDELLVKSSEKFPVLPVRIETSSLKASTR